MILKFKTDNFKPNQATMRPGCVSTCIEHVEYIERQMDALTDEMTE